MGRDMTQFFTTAETALVLLDEHHPARSVLSELGLHVEDRSDLYSLLFDLEQDPRGYAVCVVDEELAGGNDLLKRQWQSLGSRACRVPRMVLDRGRQKSEFYYSEGLRVCLRDPASKISLRVAMDYLMPSDLNRFAA